MSPVRWGFASVGLVLWGLGLWRFAAGGYVAGGLLMLVGGACVMVAASGGWTEFVEGVANWLAFWR